MTQLTEQKAHVPHEFDRVAHGYDKLAALNPGYEKHLRWSAKRMELAPNAKVLDLCCGTGTSTTALRKTYPNAAIVGLDASSGMLALARAKSHLSEVKFVLGDAMDPAAAGVTGPFDGILMGYGIRNVPDADRCLDRIYELLAPGGTICFHEYSVVDSAFARVLWNIVCTTVIIPGGFITSGQADIYRYLRRSVNAFDGVKAFEDRLRKHGFVDVRTEPMDGWQRGILHSFLAKKPRAQATA